MHWSVLIVFAWLYLLLWDLLATVIASLAFFALLIAHEFGHVAVLRWRKIPVEEITFFGIHGRTSYGYAPPADEILIAWGGVTAQVAILILALVAGYALSLSPHPILSVIVGPILFVFTKLNLFLMIVALLPIGPFDGHNAWAAIPWIRAVIRRRRREAKEKAARLSPERRRELEESSTRATAELMEKLAKKNDAPKEDA
jgi:Zn-dependent protease